MTNILICSMMVLNKSFSISEWMFMDVCSFIGPYLPTFELNKKSLTGSEKSGSPGAPLFLHFKNILRSCRISEKYFWNFNLNWKCWKYSYKLGTQGIKRLKMGVWCPKHLVLQGIFNFIMEIFVSKVELYPQVCSRN